MFLCLTTSTMMVLLTVYVYQLMVQSTLRTSLQRERRFNTVTNFKVVNYSGGCDTDVLHPPFLKRIIDNSDTWFFIITPGVLRQGFFVLYINPMRNNIVLQSLSKQLLLCGPPTVALHPVIVYDKLYYSKRVGKNPLGFLEKPLYYSVRNNIVLQYWNLSNLLLELLNNPCETKSRAKQHCVWQSGLTIRVYVPLNYGDLRSPSSRMGVWQPHPHIVLHMVHIYVFIKHIKTSWRDEWNESRNSVRGYDFHKFWRTRSRFAHGSIPRVFTPMWEKVVNCG